MATQIHPLEQNLLHWRNTRVKLTQPTFDFEKDYSFSCSAIRFIANELLRNEGKEFIVDKNNNDIIKFLLLYFNQSPEANKVFPKKKYSLKKNILLIGPPGTGKTLLMQVFSEYLRKSGNMYAFRNIGVTELLNYHKMYGHANLFTYNQQGANTFEGAPVQVCLNDLGLQLESQKSYGTDMRLIIEEFLFSRYEIWLNRGVRYHITSNQTIAELKQMFEGRLIDRLKAFNVLVLDGDSRR